MPETLIAGAFAGLLVTAAAALEDSVGVALHGEHWLLLIVVGADGQFWGSGADVSTVIDPD